jgi:hypothetical protein
MLIKQLKNKSKSAFPKKLIKVLFLNKFSQLNRFEPNMGKVDLFTIELQKQVPIFFGGETVVGNVKIQLKERLKINALKLIVKGGAQVRW